MAQSDDQYGPRTRIERWTEEFLVRIIAGIGMAVLLLVMTPLVLGWLNPWWFAATAALGFLVGFVGGDALGSHSSRVRRPTRRTGR